MPIHDWKRVEPGIFHDFHQTWAIEIKRALNGGLLPDGYSAVIEQYANGFVPDVLTLEHQRRRDDPNKPKLATLPRPRTAMVFETNLLHERANRVAIRHRLADVVCIIEIVSPGNKSNAKRFRDFVEKMCDFINGGVNALVVDLFPPTPRDPHGVHKAIWDELSMDDVPFEMPPDKPLTLAAYTPRDPQGFFPATAFVEPVGVGSVMIDMPAYLDDDFFVSVPLESTYQAALATSTRDIRFLVEHGKLPDE